MAILKIARMGHPILYQAAAEIADPTAPEIAELAQDMKDTLVDVGGAGLAAPQVYRSLRLVVYRLTPRHDAKSGKDAEGQWHVLVNPKITLLSEDRIEGWERCLSIPELHGKVPRSPSIQMVHQTLSGDTVDERMDGVRAVLLQHECDHLDGILYPMRMTDMATFEFNSDPGGIAADLAAGSEMWPVFRDMVQAWPGRPV